MSEQHSTPEERSQFEAALNDAVGQRSAEQNAATAASLDQALADTRQRKADALADPSHPFHRAPASFPIERASSGWRRFPATAVASSSAR